MSTPSKYTYEQALETIKKYEQRQKQLEKLNKDLGDTLSFHFEKFRFDVDEKKRLVIFAGITHNGNLTDIPKEVSHFKRVKGDSPTISGEMNFGWR